MTRKSRSQLGAISSFPTLTNSHAQRKTGIILEGVPPRSMSRNPTGRRPIHLNSSQSDAGAIDA